MKPLPAFALVLIAAGALAGCNETKPAAHENPSRPVLVATVHYAPRERLESLPGVLKARVESELAFRVGGRLERRLVDAGQFVRQGDALATLDETDLKLQFETAEADLAQARSARYQAEAEERRVTTLSQKGFAANAEYDKAKSTADQARGAVEKSERAVALAKNSLAYATLTADADGVISLTEAEPGEVVAAGTPIMRLAHTDAKEAAVAIPEAFYERAQKTKASVEFWALPGVKAEAVLRELSPSADPATRTYAARFSLPSPPPGARLGMSVTVTLADGAPALARVPLGAVFDLGAGPGVWIVDPASGAVKETSVVVANSDGEFAYLSEGAPEGAKIVALGVHKIDAHEKVRIVDTLAGL
jgi:RND family efflux transporter MFP subunit